VKRAADEMISELGQSVKKISLWIFLVMSQPVGRTRTPVLRGGTVV